MKSHRLISIMQPEVRNRTLEEITEMFENGVSARKFSSESLTCVALDRSDPSLAHSAYKCVSAEHTAGQMGMRTESIASEKGSREEEREENLGVQVAQK